MTEEGLEKSQNLGDEKEGHGFKKRVNRNPNQSVWHLLDSRFLWS